MVRVLRPGGRLVITDMDRHDHEWMRQEMADEWLGFERGQIKAWLREAGLVNLIVDCTGRSCCATSQADATAAAEISVFLATGSRRVSGAREAVRGSYGALAESGASTQTTLDSPARGRRSAVALGSCCSSSNAMEFVDCAPPEIVLYDTGQRRAVGLRRPSGRPVPRRQPDGDGALRPGEVAGHRAAAPASMSYAARAATHRGTPSVRHDAGDDRAGVEVHGGWTR
jgi:hypothetical protein